MHSIYEAFGRPQRQQRLLSSAHHELISLDQGSATSAWSHCMQIKAAVRAPSNLQPGTGYLQPVATRGNPWQLVNDYQFVINGRADRCCPEPKCASAIGIISRWRVETGERRESCKMGQREREREGKANQKWVKMLPALPEATCRS